MAIDATAGSLLQKGSSDSRGLGIEAGHQKELCPMQPATSLHPEGTHRGLFLGGLGQRAGHAQTNRPLCRSTKLGSKLMPGLCAWPLRAGPLQSG